MTGSHSQDLSPRIAPANLLCLTWLTDCHARPKSLIKIMSGVKRWTSPVLRPYPPVPTKRAITGIFGKFDIMAPQTL